MALAVALVVSNWPGRDWTRRLSFFDLCFGWRFGLDAFELEHELLGGGCGDVGFDEASGEEGAAVAIEGEERVGTVGIAVNLAEVHVDAAGEGSAEGVVHDLNGLEVGCGDGNAEAVGDEGCLGCAGLVDQRDAEGWGCGRGRESDFGCRRSGPCAEVMFGETLCFVDGDVAGEDEGGVGCAVVAGVEAGDVVAGEASDGFDGADGGFAVGLVAVEETGPDAACGCDDGVTFLGDGDETLLADALNVVRVEGRVLDYVGEEVETGVGVV